MENIMLSNFKDFMDNVIVENLHPELQNVVLGGGSNKSKQKQLADKIKDLTSRGESTGIEGNMPKGSSRAYMQHAEPENVIVDKKIVPMKVGTKVAIKSVLDRYHNHKEHDGLHLGAMQNHAENNDHWVNNTHRVLTHKGDGHFETNTDSGIFPPLLDHDERDHQWTKVGHARDVKASDWKKLTKTKDHPKGITHSDFVNTLVRFHNRNNGKHWEGSAEKEKNLDKVEQHPLVQKFIDYHGNTGNSPADYRQQKNLGVWKHPVDGSEHIVARDHGFNHEVEGAYRAAHKKRNGW
jgi:hypothetical protein